MTETNENASFTGAVDRPVSTLVTPSDISGMAKRGTNWEGVMSVPAVQVAARGALAALRRLELAVAIAQDEMIIATTSIRVAEAEARIEAFRAELAQIDSGEPT